MIHVCFVALENPKKMKLACLLLIKIGKAGFTGMRIYLIRPSRPMINYWNSIRMTILAATTQHSFTQILRTWI